MFRKIFLIFIFFSFIVFVRPSFADTKPVNTLNEAVVLNMNNSSVRIKMLTGDFKNKILSVKKISDQVAYQLSFKTGDHVIVTVSVSPGGKTDFYITDVDRKPFLLLLLAIFILLVFLVARVQGLTSIIGMIFSFYVIAQVIIPNILAGTDPIVAIFVGAILIIPVTYYLAHGFNKKTHIAMSATFLTLILTAILAYGFTVLTKLTGFSSEESVYLQSALPTGTIDMKKLLLAGIVIGALAVLNDITISQASIVESLRLSNSKLTFWQLYSHAMKVGRDHVASLVNTLVLVYIGASFPLVILFYNSPVSIGLIANQEIIATEIVRTLVTSIGIVAAVPITTYLSCVFIKN